MFDPKDLKASAAALGSQLAADVKGDLHRAMGDSNQAMSGLTEQQKTQLSNYCIVTDYKDGYEFIETSSNWKQICSTLPCFTQCWWADYLTAVVPAEISISGKKKNVIIQLWKGWCQRFGGHPADDFPGGIGAEVGVYEIVDAAEASNGAGGSYWFYKPSEVIDRTTFVVRRELTAAAPLLSVALPRRQMLVANSLPPGTVWYPVGRPYPWISFHLTFREKTFFTAEPQHTYWRTRWMDPTDYHSKYAKKHDTPILASQYTLHYKVAGHTFQPW